MTGTAIALRYAIFAAMATALNLAVQRGSLGVAPDNLPLAIATGTLAGLVLKYLLDKYLIFDDPRGGLHVHGRQFTLYAAMGLATTALFWATEYAFWAIWGTRTMRELGAVIGLGVGYLLKYRLDRRFVFRAAPALPA